MDSSEVGLHNCDREPIHIPGAVQPHGALLAMAGVDETVAIASESVTAHLGVGISEVFDETFGSLFGERARVVVRTALQLGEQARINPLEIEREGARFDVIVHASGPFAVVELEPRDAADDLRRYIADGNLATARLQAAQDLESLFQTVTEEVARITGFDRVMLYRFHPDDSGEVVAECRGDASLRPYLGLRYPESDIPSQARRLYLENRLRLIADVMAVPSPLRFDPRLPAGDPLDLSHATLRSVSPIHIEYLRNMDVGASMSISLVVDGRLFGLIACHHGTAHRVPYAVRMACEHLGRAASLQLGAIVDRARSRARSAAAATIGRLVRRTERRASLREALLDGDTSLATLVPAAGSVSVVEGQEVHSTPGAPPPELIRELVPWLATHGAEVVVDDLGHRFAPAAAHADETAGVLAVEVDREAPVWVLWHRPQQARTVRWGHEPSKQVVTGPNGPRLTPPGSFDTWLQSVEGRSAPWADTDVEAARELRHALTSAVLLRLRRQAATRQLFMRIVGHDLRSPLSAIVQGTELLGSDISPQIRDRAAAQLRRSSHRMQEMLERFFDFQRIEAGLGLELRPRRTDVTAVVQAAVDEVRMAHPNLEIEVDLARAVAADVDEDRLAQVVANLLANARHHGDGGRTVKVRLWSDEDVHLTVHNWGAPIPQSRQREIFDAYQGLSEGRRPRGLGLGLHIVRWIVEAHQGQISVSSSEGNGTTFEVRLPAASRR